MIAAFDLGIKNFAFAVKDNSGANPEQDKNNGVFVLLKNTRLGDKNLTRVDLNKLKKEELLKTIEIDPKNESKEKLKKKDIIDLILSKIKTDAKKQEKVQKHPKDLGLSMFEIMDEYKDIWSNCNIFLIERQMTTNFQALKLSHYLEAYLKINYPTKKILNYNASMKTKKLGAVDLKTKKDRKDWTIQFVKNLLDGDNLRYFESLSKKDDVADVVCMIESYLL